MNKDKKDVLAIGLGGVCLYISGLLLGLGIGSPVARIVIVFAGWMLLTRGFVFDRDKRSY